MEQRNSSGGVKKREIFGSGRVGSTKTPSLFHSAATNHAVYNCALFYLLIAPQQVSLGQFGPSDRPPRIPTYPHKVIFSYVLFSQSSI